jgi:hypothetical protein
MALEDEGRLPPDHEALGLERILAPREGGDHRFGRGRLGAGGRAARGLCPRRRARTTAGRTAWRARRWEDMGHVPRLLVGRLRRGATGRERHEDITCAKHFRAWGGQGPCDWRHRRGPLRCYRDSLAACSRRGARDRKYYAI